MFGIFGPMAEFERVMLRQRTNVGPASARKRGRVGGGPRRINVAALTKARALLASGAYGKGQGADELGVSRHTLWRALASAGRRRRSPQARPGRAAPPQA